MMDHLMLVVFNALSYVTWGFFVWLYYYTRLKSALVSVIWFVVAHLLEYPLIQFAHQYAARFNEVSPWWIAWQIFRGVMDVGLLVWVVLSLVRWARPGERLSWKRAPQSGTKQMQGQGTGDGNWDAASAA